MTSSSNLLQFHNVVHKFYGADVVIHKYIGLQPVSICEERENSQKAVMENQ